MLLQFTVNGKAREADIEPDARLIDVLRDHLDLTGTKESCGEGECGACTVIMDGVAVNACLVQMASQVGSAQIRNMARLPGNIANASPGGDAVPALIALDAAALVLDGSGMTTVRRVDEVVTGIGRTTLRTGEAIIGVRIPRPGPDQRSAFGKIGMGARTRVVIANVSLTLVLEVDPAQGRIQDARVVLGSAAPVAFHARTAEALLKGRRPDPALAGDLAGTLRAEVKASIQEIAIFQHKLNDIQGLALDLFAQLFPGEQ